MTERSRIDELVDGWWRHDRLRRTDPRAAEQDDGWSDVIDYVNAHGVGAIPLIAALVAGAADDDAIVLIGAGPLEDLINDHGAEAVDELERLARQEPRFRQALSAVWLEKGALPPDVAERISFWTAPSAGAN